MKATELRKYKKLKEDFINLTGLKNFCRGDVIKRIIDLAKEEKIDYKTYYVLYEMPIQKDSLLLIKALQYKFGKTILTTKNLWLFDLLYFMQKESIELFYETEK